MYLVFLISSLCFVNAFGAHTPSVQDIITFPESPPADTPHSSKETPDDGHEKPMKLTSPGKGIPEPLDQTLKQDMQLEELVRDVRRTGFGKKIIKRKRVVRPKVGDTKEEQAAEQEGGTKQLNSGSFKNEDSLDIVQSATKPQLPEDHFFTHAREFKSELDHFLNHQPSDSKNTEDVLHIEKHKAKVKGKFEEEHFLEYANEFKSELERYLKEKQLRKSRTSKSEEKNVNDAGEFDKNTAIISELQEDSSQDFKTEVEKYFEKARVLPQYQLPRSGKHNARESATKQDKEAKVENIQERSESGEFNQDAQNFKAEVDKYFEKARLSAQYAPADKEVSKQESSSFEDNSFVASSRMDKSDITDQVPSLKLIQPKIDRADFFEDNGDFVTVPQKNGIHFTHIPIRKRTRLFPVDSKKVKESQQVFNDLSSSEVNRRGDFAASGPYPPRFEEGHTFTLIETGRYPETITEGLKPYPEAVKEGHSFEHIEGLKSEEGHSFRHVDVSRRYPESIKEEGNNFEHIGGLSPYPGLKSEGHTFGFVDLPKYFPGTEKKEGHSIEHIEESKPYPGSKTEEGHTFIHVDVPRRYHESVKEEHSFEHIEGSKPYPEGLKTEEGHKFGYIDVSRHYPDSVEEGHSFEHIKESKRYPGPKTEEGYSFENIDIPRRYPGSVIEEHNFEHIEGSKLYPGKTGQGHTFGYVDIPRRFPGSIKEEQSFEHIKESKPYPESKFEEGKAEVPKHHQGSVKEVNHGFEILKVTRPYSQGSKKKGRNFRRVKGLRTNSRTTSEKGKHLNNVGSKSEKFKNKKDHKLENVEVLPPGHVKVFAPYPLAKVVGNSPSTITDNVRYFKQVHKHQGWPSAAEFNEGNSFEQVEIPIASPPFKLQNGQESTDLPPYPPSISDHKQNHSNLKSHSLIQNNKNEKELGTVTSTLTNDAPESNPELASLEHLTSPYPRPYPPTNTDTLPHDQPFDIQFSEPNGEFNVEDKRFGVHVPVEVSKSNFQTSHQSTVNATGLVSEVSRLNGDVFISDSFRPPQVSNQIFNDHSPIYVPVPKSEFLKNIKGFAQSINDTESKGHALNTLAIINSDLTLNRESDNDFVPTLPHRFTYINHVSALSPENQATFPPKSSPDKDYLPSLPFRLHQLSREIDSDKVINESQDQNNQSVTKSNSSQDSTDELVSKDSLDESVTISDLKGTSVKHKSLSEPKLPASEYGLPEL